MYTEPSESAAGGWVPWNKGGLVGPKPPFKLKEIWAVRIRLQIANRARQLALLNLAIDSKLRGCDLVALRVEDVAHGARAVGRATIVQRKTGHSVRFELTDQTRESIETWIAKAGLEPDQFPCPSRRPGSEHLSTRQYSRIVKGWPSLIGLDPQEYGAHSMRRAKATLIYRRTQNLRAVQLLLGHTNLESTVRYLCIEVDDALEMAEQTEVRDSAAGSNRRLVTSRPSGVPYRMPILPTPEAGSRLRSNTSPLQAILSAMPDCAQSRRDRRGPVIGDRRTGAQVGGAVPRNDSHTKCWPRNRPRI